jgi:signal transduction histidine kinase
LTSLTLGPVFLTWLSESPRSSALTSHRRRAEAALLGVILIVVCTIAFEVSARTVASGFLPAVLYTPLPFILWSTIRFGEKGASGAIFIVTLVLIWRTLKGPSLFVGADPETNVLALQLFLIGLSIPVLLLGAALDELRHAEEVTRELAGSVLTAQDEERRRIARDLHDTTGQNLVVANLLVERLRNTLPESNAIVQQIGDSLQQSIGELRTVSYLLHPPMLDEAGLELALRHYVEGFSERSGLNVDLDPAPDLGRFPGAVELALFRVVQEALTNVSRHSGSTTARIRVRRGMARERHCVILTIHDSGNGMPGAPRPTWTREGRSAGGLGLASMRERLHQLGGWLEVESTIGRTIITAIVPLNDSDRQSRA